MMTTFGALFMPYCLVRQPDGRYIVMNREYKPLVFLTNQWIGLDRSQAAVSIGLTKKTISRLSWQGSADERNIYLYDDGCNPLRSHRDMEAYLARLELLARLDVAF